VTGRSDALAAPCRPDALAAPCRPDALAAPCRPDALAAPGRPDALAAPARPDAVVPGVLLAGLLALYLPTFHDWATGVWADETQGHELLIVAVSGWLLARRRAELQALPDAASRRPGIVAMALGVLLYVVGRSQGVVRLELASLIVVLAALLLFFKGAAALRRAWFPLAFLLFALPLPFTLVLTLTGPLKAGASAAATQLLAWAGYPAGRSGVVITIGQYQLLVSEACAGLQTMFTLEAMGLLYASLMNHASVARNVLLTLLVVPVSFGANVVRVMALALITHHFGDAAGQGFLHGFAGLVMFVVALALIMLVDRALGRVFRDAGAPR